VRLNRNGIFDVTQASLIETIEEPNPPAESMESTPATEPAQNGIDQNPPTTEEKMEEVSS
ncbi:unnamed protein product, partial [Rotaria magnacalcarata]